MYISCINLLVLDVSCQHLGDECDLEGFLVPFGHRVEKYMFWDYISCTYNLGDINYLNIVAGIGYKEPTMGGGDIYILGLYVSCTCLADMHI